MVTSRKIYIFVGICVFMAVPKPYLCEDKEISFGLAEYNLSKLLDEEPVKQPNRKLEFNGEKLCFECYHGETFRRIEFNGELYLVPGDLCDLIKEPDDLALFDSFQTPDKTNIVYGRKTLPRETRFSDLNKEELARLTNELYASHRGDNPFRSSHGDEHYIETRYQPW